MAPVGKVLVVRVGRAGDMVMITAALRRLLQRHAQAELHLLTSTDGRRVLKDFDPRITKVLLYERKSLTGMCARRALRRAIADTGYEHIYCFELNPSYRKLFRGSGAEVHSVQNSREVQNYAARCLQAVDPAYDETRDPEWVWLPVTDAGRAKARLLLQQAGIGDDTYVVAFHPSFSGLRKSWVRSLVHRQQKSWPAESYGELARLLTDYAAARGIKLRVIMDMLPDDRAIGEAIVAASGNRITLLIAPPDFDRYKALLERIDLLVVPNTGPMHIAGAVGTRVVTLFAQLDPRDSSPYIPASQLAILRAEDTPHPEQGLCAISPSQVFAACRRYVRPHDSAQESGSPA